jgi:hypothetical protein
VREARVRRRSASIVCASAPQAWSDFMHEKLELRNFNIILVKRLRNAFTASSVSWRVTHTHMLYILPSMSYSSYSCIRLCLHVPLSVHPWGQRLCSCNVRSVQGSLSLPSPAGYACEIPPCVGYGARDWVASDTHPMTESGDCCATASSEIALPPSYYHAITSPLTSSVIRLYSTCGRLWNAPMAMRLRE